MVAFLEPSKVAMAAGLFNIVVNARITSLTSATK